MINKIQHPAVGSPSRSSTRTRSISTCLLTLVLAAAPLCSRSTVGADSWSQWRGPSRTALLPDSGKLPEKLSGDEGLTLKWQKQLGPSYSGPVISDGILVTTETVDRKFERVIAYEVETGKELWTQQWEGAMSVPFFAKKNGDWIRATPSIAQGRVYVAGMQDVLACLDLKSGEVLWKCDFKERFKTPDPAFGFASSPLVDEGFVYAQAGGAFCKLNAETGETVWRTLEGEAGMDSAFASPVIATLRGVRQLVVQTRNDLCGVDIESGKVMWNQPIDAFRGMNILTPTIQGDSVFTSAYGGRANLWQVNLDDSGKWTVEELWDEKYQAYMASPVLIGDYLYMHLRNTRFMCVEMSTGKEMWSTTPLGEYWSMVATPERILSLASDGVLRLIDPSPEDYRELDRIEVADDTAWAHLAVVDSMVIVRHLGGLKVYSFSSEK